MNLFTKHTIFIFLLVFMVASCDTKKQLQDSQRAPIVEINGSFLFKDDVDKIIPKNATMVDSANIADRYIQKWITNNLVYQNAKNNIRNTSDIEKLVEEYRRSLIIHEYEQSMVAERVDTVLSDEELSKFYEEYKEHLTLDEHLVKGVLLVTPLKTPEIKAVRLWVEKADTTSIEKIEKYSLTNAVSFDNFMDEWKPFVEVVKNIPLNIEDSQSFLAKNKFVETSDSTKHYFLKISNVIFKGDIEPLEKSKDKISYIVRNQKKADFIINFEASIYKDAIKSGEVKFY